MTRSLSTDFDCLAHFTYPLVLVSNSFEGCFRAWECAAVAVRDPFQFHELFDRHVDACVSVIIRYLDVSVGFVTVSVIRMDDL